jgi:hypothetical protein
MKKAIFIFTLLCMCSVATFAQLKVTSDGKVGIGITTTPVSKLAVGHVGDQYFRSSFQGDIVTVNITGLGNSPYNANHWGTGLLVKNTPNSTRGDKGVDVGVSNSSPSNSGRAIGITGYAGNATPGYNYGVIGSLSGSNNGTGILGDAAGNAQGIYIDGKYAGYFNGNVKVTGTINGTLVGNSDMRYKQNIAELGSSDRGIGSGSELKRLTGLVPISYNYRQVYITPETKSDTLEVPIGQFDEKSQMFRKKHFGLIAQDLQKIYPDLVYESDNGYLAINYVEIIPLLIQSIKELKEEVDMLASTAITARSTMSNDLVNDLSQAVLYQNAPNPFTDRTEIKFILPENTANASIFVFNMQGALIKQVPVHARQSSVVINGSELTAGMYLYSLVLEGKMIDTKRMILTK